jgi:hypothetical protein
MDVALVEHLSPEHDAIEEQGDEGRQPAHGPGVARTGDADLAPPRSQGGGH